MNWKTKRKIGRAIKNGGFVLALPGLLLAFPGLWLMDKGDDVVLTAQTEKPLPSPIHDPNFVKSTRVE